MMSRMTVFIAFGVMVGCGGEVAPEQAVSTPSPENHDAQATAPGRSTTSSDSSSGSSSKPSEAAPSERAPFESTDAQCVPEAAPFDPMTCRSAIASFSVMATGLAWSDEVAAGDPVTGTLDILYRNKSPRAVWTYPGVRIVSSDPRVIFPDQTPTAGSGPDLYTVGGPCAQAPSQHTLKLASDIPSGTKVTLTLSPILLSPDDVEGSGYSDCDGNLIQTTYEFLVP